MAHVSTFPQHHHHYCRLLWAFIQLAVAMVAFSSPSLNNHNSWRLLGLTSNAVNFETRDTSYEIKQRIHLCSCDNLVVSEHFSLYPTRVHQLNHFHILHIHLKSSPWLLIDAALGRSTKTSGWSTSLPATALTTGSAFHKRLVPAHRSNVEKDITRT
jgi:hypothetical protein